MWNFVAANAFKIGLKGLFQSAQHERSNSLHRQSIAQAQRIHETEQRAASAYHNVSMGLAFSQHKRGMEQTRLMHEENMDLEKRIAMRENIRDEWGQYGERAGTILTVNTLMLGIAFLMLIDGPIPDCVPLTLPQATVIYYCLLTSAINLLLFSVRYAVLLRSRIGSTIVTQMKEAIEKAKKRDKEFRDNEIYKCYNQPATVEDIYEDEKFEDKVKTLPALLKGRNERNRKDAVEADLSQIDLSQMYAFVDDRPEGYENLSWVKEQTGFHHSSMLGLGLPKAYLPCAKRNRAQHMHSVGQTMVSPTILPPQIGAALASRSSSQDEPVTPMLEQDLAAVDDAPRPMLQEAEPELTLDHGPAALDAAQPRPSMIGAKSESLALSRTRQPSFITERFNAVDTNCDGKISKEEFADAARNGLLEDFQEGWNALNDLDPDNEDESKRYSALTEARCTQDSTLQRALEYQWEEYCKPWNEAADWLFKFGTVSQILAACMLVFLRYASPQVELQENEKTPRASKLSALGFCVPALAVILFDIVFEILYQASKKAYDKDEEKWIEIPYGDRSDLYGEKQLRQYLGRDLKDDDVVKTSLNREIPYCQFAKFTGEELIKERRFPIQIKVKERWTTIEYSELYGEQQLRQYLGKEVTSQIFGDDVVKNALDEEISFFRLAQFSGEELKRQFPLKIKAKEKPKIDRWCLSHISLATWCQSTVDVKNDNNWWEKMLSFRLGKAVPVVVSMSGFIFAIAGFSEPSREVEDLLPPVVREAQAPTHNAMSTLPLAPVPLMAEARWPSFWEPTGAAWWPTRNVLALVGGVDVWEFDMSGLQSLGGSQVSKRHRISTSSPPADVCISRAGSEDELWVASSGDAFTISNWTGSIASSLQVPTPKDAVAPPAFTAVRAVGCSHMHTATRFWIASNYENGWPDILGMEARAEAVNGSNALLSWRWEEAPVQKWPVRWLLSDKALSSAFVELRSAAPSGATVESIHVKGNGDLVLLVTFHWKLDTDKPRPPTQVVALVSVATGRLLRWWLLPFSGAVASDSAAAALGIGRWIGIAADEASQSLFLVAGGLQPTISVSRSLEFF